jgi:catechol 2,3-dioxygenase-like lactoylglutathione lyase family enzyme
MVNGIHVLFYSTNANADRAFARDVLGLRSVDIGDGWLIFKMPPAEAAFHPADASTSGTAHAGHRLLSAAVYLMCDDLRATMADLAAKRVSCTEIEEEDWGLRTTVRLPSGGELGLYQPTHPTALEL